MPRGSMTLALFKEMTNISPKEDTWDSMAAAISELQEAALDNENHRSAHENAIDRACAHLSNAVHPDRDDPHSALNRKERLIVLAAESKDRICTGRSLLKLVTEERDLAHKRLREARDRLAVALRKIGEVVTAADRNIDFAFKREPAE